MLPAIKILQNDIGKKVKVLCNGKYLEGEIIGYHREHYIAYVVDTGNYEKVNFKYCEDI